MPVAILLVDHSLERCRAIGGFLAQHGFRTHFEPMAERALGRVSCQPPELVILEAQAPRADGLAVCRSIRRVHDGPILVLSDCADVDEEIMALESGADAVLAQPVNQPVNQPLLLARVRALTRRRYALIADRFASRHVAQASNVRATLKVGTLRVSRSARTVQVRGHVVGLTTTEFELLWLLVRHAGETLSRDFIRRSLSGREYDGLDRTVDLRVSKLRKKLGDRARQPALIKSVRGVGYQLAC